MKGSSGLKNLFAATFLKISILLPLSLIGGFGKRINDKAVISALNTQPEIQRTAVLLNNQLQLIPLRDLKSRKIASINLGSKQSVAFDKMLANYAPVKAFHFSSAQPKAFDNYNTIVLHLNSETLLNADAITFIQEIEKNKEVIVAGFGNIASLPRLDQISSPVIWHPEQTTAAAEYLAQVIFGGEGISGKLELTLSTRFPAGAGYTTSRTRLKYARPDEIGINPAKLEKIDDIVFDAIEQRATPGAVVMVVKNGNVIFNKAYGTHTYESSTPTAITDIFDVASVTKTAATTIAAMKLFEQQKLDLNAGIGNYLSDARYSNKNNIPVRDVLLHQAGFVNLDFFGGIKPQDHDRDSSYLYSVKAADNYYLRKDYYKDVMWPRMLRSPLPTRGQYVYSDISMYVMKEIIEEQSQMSLDKYVAEEFYKPLGMRTAGFNPLERFNKNQVVPTERDNYFRKTLLQGYVHDSGASMAGGVSGHAGLFASANDLAILNQMLLNGGSYGGVEYFKPETIHLFTSKQSDVSRRGLGFDRGTGRGYPSRYASSETYGHTGYTGTCVWVDPKEDLIYIFLSNRVYPSASSRLNSLRIRPRIQDVIYEAIADGNRNLADNSGK